MTIKHFHHDLLQLLICRLIQLNNNSNNIARDIEPESLDMICLYGKITVQAHKSN